MLFLAHVHLVEETGGHHALVSCTWYEGCGLVVASLCFRHLAAWNAIGRLCVCLLGCLTSVHIGPWSNVKSPAHCLDFRKLSISLARGTHLHNSTSIKSRDEGVKEPCSGLLAHSSLGWSSHGFGDEWLVCSECFSSDVMSGFWKSEGSMV